MSRQEFGPSWDERRVQGSERRAELAAKAAKAEAQRLNLQLTKEGIVVLDPRSDSLLGRLGRAISPHTKKAALFTSVVLAFIAGACGSASGGTGDAEPSPVSTEPIAGDSLQKPVPRSLEQIPALAAELAPHPIPPLVGIGGLNTFEGFPSRLKVIAENPNRTSQEAEIFNLVYGDPIKTESGSYKLTTSIEVVLRQEATKFLGDLYEEGLLPEQIQFFIVDANSPGILGEVYQDLARRGLGATTVEDYPGLKETFNTPFLLFLTPNLAFESSPEFLSRLVIHEFRHIRQAIGNPNLQEDFRNPDGSFTTYAAFMEAWADEGLCTTPKYRSCWDRMPTLRALLREYQQANGILVDSNKLINMAGKGDKTAYNLVMSWYENAAGYKRSFVQLFPPYW